MKHFLIIFSLLINYNVTQSKPIKSKHKDIAFKILILNPVLKKSKANQIAKIIDNESRKRNISPDIFISIIKTESDFNQMAVSSTGDISIAQINVPVWQKEFKRLKKKPIHKKRLLKDKEYAIYIMGEILTVLKNNYSKKDKNWMARYHSNTPIHKTRYLAKLNLYIKKANNVRSQNIASSR